MNCTIENRTHTHRMYIPLSTRTWQHHLQRGHTSIVPQHPQQPETKTLFPVTLQNRHQSISPPLTPSKLPATEIPKIQRTLQTRTRATICIQQDLATSSQRNASKRRRILWLQIPVPVPEVRILAPRLCLDCEIEESWVSCYGAEVVGFSVLV